MQPPITPFLWFDTEAEDAANFYTSVFPNSRIVAITHYGEAGPRPAGMVMTVAFELNGQRFTALNAGPEPKFNHAVSFVINCKNQDEVDRYWELLTDDGQEVACGWLTDRFGLSWQVVPEGLIELITDADPERAQRATEAMLSMTKLDIEAMRRAADGVAAAS
jgi:predicted 3-demethylubiquinone-9 3-methyltransferase (glyoxalase superfamily)